MEVRTKSHPQPIEISAESIVSYNELNRVSGFAFITFLQETKSSDSEESDSETEETASKEEPVNPQVHKVKRFQ